MKNNVIIINGESIDSISEGYFSRICGFNRGNKRAKKMMQDGLNIREKIRSKINVKAVVSSFEEKSISGRTLNLNGVNFTCNAFQKINYKNILKVYAYILTAGNFELEESSMINMFYADTWGTSYVDAGRDILKNIIKEDYIKESSKEGNYKEKQVYISDSFGPGYYGMDVTQIGEFFKILDGESIEVKLANSGMMIPLKSCAGFFIILDDETQLPGEDCKSCLSDFKGCEFCRTRTRVDNKG